MLDDLVMIEESELPELTDSKMEDLAREMGEEFLEEYKQPRQQLETQIWPAVDKAFMCIRDEMNFIPTMRLIDNGSIGESDLRDAAKSLRNQIVAGVMPADESFLEAVAMNEQDTDEDLTQVKNVMMHLNEEAKSRGAITSAVDQLLIRGTTAVGVKWVRQQVQRRIPRELAQTLKQYDPEMDKRRSRQDVPFWETVFNGPRIYPIDMYRLYFDSKAELDVDDDIATVYITFKSITELKRAVDEDHEPLYDQKILEQIEPWTYQDWYAENPEACRSTKIMGIDPSLETAGEFIPVYLFHKRVRETEDGDVFVDKFFYLAHSSASMEWRIIRVQDNPSTRGDKPFYFTQCDRWLNLPYGTGIVEKSLSAWKKKNVLSAIGMNRSVIELFPPYSYATGVLKEDKKPKWMPAGGQEIIMRPGIGMDWIKPYPITPMNSQYGMQDERYQSEKIISQTGVSAAGVIADPTKSMSKSKTATEIRQTATDGVVSQEELVTRFNEDIMQPVQNSMLHFAQQYYEQDTPIIARSPDGRMKMQNVTPDFLQRSRIIKIVGRRGLASKANEMQNMLEALKILATPQAMQVLQNLPLMVQDLMIKLLTRLGLPMKDEYRISPEMLAAQTPQAQMAALHGAMQNPQMREQMAQQLVQSPEGQQFIMQMAHQVQQETLSQHHEHQAAVKQEASAQVAQEKANQQAFVQQQKAQEQEQ